MTTITLASALSSAVGAKAGKKLRDAFGHETVEDLLVAYPRSYVPRGETSDPGSVRAGEHTTVLARVVSVDQKPYRDRRTGRPASRTEVVLAIGQGTVAATFFDTRTGIAAWRRRKLVVGETARFEGRADWDRFHRRWQLVHPHSDIFESREPASGDAPARGVPSGLVPIYRASKKVASWTIEETVRIVLDVLAEVPDALPEDVRRERGLVGAAQALRWIHRPDDEQEMRAALTRLRFEEAFVAQTVLARRRAATRLQVTTPRTGGGALLARFDERLPFSLTTGQQRVGEEILGDLAAGHPMHRLLQGEVGSGKTVVALRAMLRVVDSGGQAALLAPTEVLAQQHERSLAALLGDLAGAGMIDGAEDGTRVSLLTGSLGASARRAVLDDLASGTAGIVVGTHALLEEEVAFHDLGLVVVDEQHRFGVEQRAALGDKADRAPHVLVMTATPIPRTVAMTVFGDLETSVLSELPGGRAGVATSVVAVQQRPAWLERAWARVREEVAAGRRAYVVCPRISAQEGESDLAAAEEVAASLSTGVLAGCRVGVLHGRQSAGEKDTAMRAFAAGETDVLVATTVIEVGVDVPDATVMVVLDADRFGVSQLHQLRGRVGRGSLPGVCLLVTRAGSESPALARLQAVAATQDGFEISRVDLEHRREGDVLGTTQSGRRTTLRLLSVLRDEDVILDARAAATAHVDRDPGLESVPRLAEVVGEFEESERGDYLEKT